MRKSVLSIGVGILIIVAVRSNAFAQGTAQISGTVKDQSGAVLPGTEVTATQTETGVARTVVSNETGLYVIPDLAVGPYRLEASLPGFRRFVQTGIILQVNGSPTINPVLEVGQVSEQVEVQANAALVETRAVGVGQVVENARILDLPLNGRNVVDLIALAGNAAPAPVLTGSSRDSFATASYSVAGGLNSGVTYILDGGNNQNYSSAGYAPLPFPDALQEFKVETSASSADKSMKSAAAVNMVTKSGTNDFHGDLFEFVRNGMFNARNAFASKRDTIKRNQFGGTAGGPVMKNKLFFFGGFQGTSIRSDPANSITYIPTASMLAGDFTAFASAACNGGRAITLKAPFVNNRVDPKLFSPAALTLTNKMGLSTTDPCGKIIYSSPVRTNDYSTVGKIDYQLNAEHSMFGRYLIEHIRTPAAYDLNHNPLSISTAVNAQDQLFTIGDTHLYGPNIVNSIRLTTNRLADGKFEPNGIATAGLGTADIGVHAFTYAPHTVDYTVTGGYKITSFGGPTRTAIFSGADDLSIVRGTHQLALGAGWTLWWANSYSGQHELPWVFNGQTTGLGFGDFLLGDVSGVHNGPVSAKNKRGNLPDIYAGDTWKVRPRLTLSYGLRWEPYIPVVDLHGGPILFSQAAFNNGTRSKQYDTTPPGVFFPGDPGFDGKEGQHKQWTNFSPRVGFAWDLRGDGKTSLRAAVGSVYDYPFGQYTNLATAPPFYPRFNLNTVNFDNPWANYPGGDPFPLPYGERVGRNAPWPGYALVDVIDANTKNVHVYQWNLNLQRQVGNDWLVSAGYLGTHTIHLWSSKQYNPSIFLGLGPCNLNGVNYTVCSTTANQDQRRRLSLQNPAFGQYYGFMPSLDYGGTASYNGLVLGVQRRAAKGVTISANYTLSHCISDPGGGTELVTSNNATSYSNPDNRHFDRGNCALSSADIRHIFNLSSVAATPQFSNSTLRAIGSGWRFSPILKIMSGSFLNVTTTQDIALSSTLTQRVSQVLANPYGDKTVSNYLNPKAFANPAPGTYANTGANAIEGPRYWTFDAALSRLFKIREGQTVEFRAEAFNLTNSFRIDNGQTGGASQIVQTLNSGNFGQVTGSLDPRIMQFSLKYGF
jgi:hypothetical protein